MRNFVRMTAVLVVALASCGVARRDTPALWIDLGADAGSVSAAPGLAEARRIARLLREEMGLPVPARTALYLYGSRARFERGLVTRAALSAASATKLADWAVGVALPESVLLLATEGSWAPRTEWPRLVAHELTHVAQIELAGGEGRGVQWLAEGMADWVAYAVLERLGLDRLEARRAEALQTIRHATAAGRLDLGTLHSSSAFVARHREVGTLLVYRLAFLVTDRLVAEAGFDRLVTYFAAFRRSRDPRRNFEEAFGVPLGRFEAAAMAALAPVAAAGVTTSDQSPEEAGAVHAVLDGRRVPVVGGARHARMPAARPGQRRREQGGFPLVEVGGRLAEVAPARGLDPVHARAELGHVEVELENAPLVERPLQLPGEERLPDLSERAPGGREPEVLRELLGDRRGAAG